MCSHIGTLNVVLQVVGKCSTERRSSGCVQCNAHAATLQVP